MDEKSADLSCSSCSTEYVAASNSTGTPHLLICSHSFCAKCVEEMIKPDVGLKCPSCEQITPFTNLEDYQVNEALLNFLIDYSDNSDLELCNQCEDKPAQLWCYSCSAAYCDECSTSLHENKALQKHEPILLRDKAHATCDIHTNENLAFFCHDCGTPVCNMCTTSIKHEKHKCDLVPRVVQSQKRFITDTIEELHNQRSLLGFMSNSSLEAEQELENNERIAKQQINEDFDTIIAVLNARRDTLLTDITEKTISSKTHLVNQRYDFAKTMAIISALELESEPIRGRHGIAFIEEVNSWVPKVKKLYEKVDETDREPAVDPEVRHTLPQKTLTEIAQSYGSVSLGTPFRIRVVITGCREKKPKSLIVDWKAESRKKEVVEYVLQQKRIIKAIHQGGPTTATGWREVIRTDRASVKITNLRPNQAYAFRVCALSKEFLSLPLDGWSKTSTFSTKGFTFDKVLKGKDLVFSKDQISVTYVGNGNWSVIITEQEFRAGVVNFQVRVNAIGTGSSKWLMAVGIIPSPSRDMNTWLGSIPGALAYVATGKKVGQTGNWGGKKYGEKYADGDIIDAQVDFKKKTLSFARNGQPQGRSHKIVATSYKFAVAFSGTKGSITLV